jgi:hypothetical protein
MARFVVGDDCGQSTLFPERIDDYLGEDNLVQAVDVFVDELDLADLGFGGVEPEATGGRDHPTTLLKIYVYGYDRARAVIGSEAIEAVADRGYYSGEEILACEHHGLSAEADDLGHQCQKGASASRTSSMSPKTMSIFVPPVSS